MNFWRHGMSTSHSSRRKFEPAFVPTTALAKSVDFDGYMMRVVLTDGREIAVRHENGLQGGNVSPGAPQREQR